MTLEEHAVVQKLTRALYPDETEVYKECTPNCPDCEWQIAEWNRLMWRVYEALSEAELL